MMKILMVLTSHDKLGNTGRKTGFWLEEFAAPYYTFLDAGATVTLASPKAGQPPLDPVSDTPEGQTDSTLRFKQDRATQAVLANTLRLADVTAEEYEADAEETTRRARLTLADLVRAGHSQSMVEASKNAFLQVGKAKSL